MGTRGSYGTHEAYVGPLQGNSGRAIAAKQGCPWDANGGRGLQQDDYWGSLFTKSASTTTTNRCNTRDKNTITSNTDLNPKPRRPYCSNVLLLRIFPPLRRV